MTDLDTSQTPTAVSTGSFSAGSFSAEPITAERFSAESWAAFWAAPELSPSASAVLAEDIVGYWPGEREPVRGLAPYLAKIAEILAAYPDLTLELIDSATVPGAVAGEELIFLHYLGRGTGPGGPIKVRGLDRVRTRDGIVVENVIRYDPGELSLPAR